MFSPTFVQTASVCCLIAASFARPVLAQPSATPVESPPPIAEAPPPEAPIAQPDEVPLAPPVQVDSQQLITRFNHAIELMIRQNFSEAQAEFERIATLSVEPERQAAARELARQSAKRFGMLPPPPPAVPPKPEAVGTLPADDDDDGRSSFLVTTTLLGLNYGWMVPVALDVDDTKSFVGLYLLAAAGSFTVPYLLTRGDHITRGMSTLGSTGSYLGFAHGALAYSLLAGQDGADDPGGARALVGLMLAGSITEGALGYWWAQKNDSSPGQASSIALGSAWGLGYGAVGRLLASGENPGFRGSMAAMLAGSVGGMLGGYYYDELRKPSEGDSRLVSFSGLLGTYLAAVPLVLGEVEDARTIAGTLLVGASLGLYAGDLLTKDVTYNRGQSGVMMLGSLAGGLVGAGGAFMVSPDDENAGKWIIAGSSVGAIVGLYAMIQAVEPQKEGPDETSVTAQLSPILGPNGETGLGVVGSF
ncbi:MAG: hypothetical protein JKY56_08750 [Kofleriaceae bacterium]|nr:hypothetical protein [Kofleriaceae bacterium]